MDLLIHPLSDRSRALPFNRGSKKPPDSEGHPAAHTNTHETHMPFPAPQTALYASGRRLP